MRYVCQNENHSFYFSIHSTHCVLLLNDESHSYPDVHSIIKKALKCADKKAEDLTELVDKEGRAIIKVGDYKECRKIQDIVERNSGRDNQPLKVSILPAYLVAHQLFAIKLCLWLENLFSKCSGK